MAGKVYGKFLKDNLYKKWEKKIMKTAALILNVIAALLLLMTVLYLLVTFAPVLPTALKVILGLVAIIYMTKQSVLLVDEVNEY